jgi:hypothetical protein
MPGPLPRWLTRCRARCTGTSDPDPSHDHREPTLGSAEDPGGAGEAWVQSFPRTVAKYIHPTHHRGPSSRWRSFLRQRASTVWACDFFCVQTITFRTLYVFFLIHHASRQVLHVGSHSIRPPSARHGRSSNAAVGTTSPHVFSFMTATAVMAPPSIGGSVISVLPRLARRILECADYKRMTQQLWQSPATLRMS